KYLRTGIFEPTKSFQTLYNAMDISNPSNFARILDLYSSTWNNIREDIKGYSYTDEETVEEIIRTHQQQAYVLDPHTGVGVLAARSYLSEHNDTPVPVLSTAHPVKFQNEL